MAVVKVYMISQDNFYPNWTSESYTSAIVARTSPKNFYQGEDLKNFLNTSIFNSTNTRLVDELCVKGADVRVTNMPDECPTIWPESTIGIAVISVSSILLVLFLFCLICSVCVCCLREENEKE